MISFPGLNLLHQLAIIAKPLRHQLGNHDYVDDFIPWFKKCTTPASYNNS